MRGLLGLACAVMISLVCSGCKTEGRPPGASDDYTGRQPACIDHDGDGFGVNCPLGADCDDTNATVTIGCHICDHPSPGCPCTTENSRAQCGKVAAQQGTQTTCSYGESVCSGGAWGECAADGKTLKSFDSAKRSLGLAPAVGCGIACDPYCQQFPDTPDNTLSTPQGLLGTDGGLTLEQSDAHVRPFSPNGPMPGNVQAALEDGGIFADAQPDAIIYHEVPPTATAQDTVAADTVVPPTSIDVYFLESSAGTVKESNRVIRDNVPAAGGTVDQVHAVVPDAWFGVGRFSTYGKSPWNDTGSPPVAFQHVLSPTLDLAQLNTALAYTYAQTVVSPASPRTWMQAIYAIATTGGLPSATPATPWVPARIDWSSPTTPSSGAGACPAGTVGYPCFRTTSVPVTVVITDAPSLSGPGGQYGIAKNAAWNLAGAKDWATVAPIAVTANPTEATARTIDPTTFAIYSGFTNNNTDAATSSTWGGGTVGNQCASNRGQSARNVIFKFAPTVRTWYHFDTIDSNYESVPYLYKKVAGVTTWIACNDKTIFGDPQFLPRSIDGVLDPLPAGAGNSYYLVVDGISGAEGAYKLHVNAMPDGGPVTAPNYNEALAAYNAIGGKVIGVDVSGNGCDVAPHVNIPRWLTQNTSNSLEKLLRDTGSVDGGMNPYLISLSNWGDACHAGDPPFATKLAQDILDVTVPGRAVASRANVTAVVVDSDDAIDFDGPPGGPNQLTPGNVDDATFVTTITTVSTPETMANCTQILANQYVGCLTATPVTFTVNIQTPATIAPLYHDQIFTFVVRIMVNGSTVLREIPIVVVVPALMPYLGDAWFVRDFDTATVCPMGTAPVWGTWAWNATTPGDSKIDFDVSVAATAAGLSAAGVPIDPLQFSNTPTTLVGQAIGVHDSTTTGDLDTQLGATYVDFTLAANMRARDSKALRIRSHLVPSTDNALTPTLKNWNLSVSCVPAE